MEVTSTRPKKFSRLKKKIGLIQQQLAQIEGTVMRQKKKIERITKWILHRKPCKPTEPNPFEFLLIIPMPKTYIFESLQNSPKKPAHLSEFSLFPHLPIELRFKVWELAREEPRVIEIQGRLRKVQDPKYFKRSWCICGCDCIALAKTPTILHVCKDSRKIGMQIYDLRFGDFLRYPVWFDSKCEALNPRDRTAWNFFYSGSTSPFSTAFDQRPVPFLVFDMRDDEMGKFAQELFDPQPIDNSELNRRTYLTYRLRCIFFEEVILVGDGLEYECHGPALGDSKWNKDLERGWDYNYYLLGKFGRELPPEPLKFTMKPKDLRERMLARL